MFSLEKEDGVKTAHGWVEMYSGHRVSPSSLAQGNLEHAYVCLMLLYIHTVGSGPPVLPTVKLPTLLHS